MYSEKKKKDGKLVEKYILRVKITFPRSVFLLFPRKLSAFEQLGPLLGIGMPLEV